MVFSSFTFLILYMPLVLMGYRMMPVKARMPFLFAVSLLFYGWGSPVWLLLLAWCLVISWGGTLLLTRYEKHQNWLLVAVLLLDLLPLFWFKYAAFFRDTLRDLTGVNIVFDTPVLPAGISFFTFQAISYVIDVWRGDAKSQRSITVFGAYLTLFPQLVAGPIVRYVDLEEQLIAKPRPTWAQMRAGLGRFSIGLAKKVLLADAVGRFWGQINGSFTQAGACGAWMGLLAFSFQIYFDFSGYSDMALGLGEAMGFYMPENFNHPYRARSLTDFWRRWHITLTVWFREYVYIPLGGNRCGKVRRDLNVLAVWALTGLWHGAGWHFVLWGLYFAVLLILEKRFILPSAWYGRLPGVLRQAGTFLLVMLGWSLFSGFGAEMLPALLGMYGAGSPATLMACAAFTPLLLICGYVSFAPRLPKVAQWRWAAPVLILLCMAALAAQGYAPFVYFQF